MFGYYDFKSIMFSNILALNKKEYTRCCLLNIVGSVSLSSSVIMLYLVFWVKAEYWLVSAVAMAS